METEVETVEIVEVQHSTNIPFPKTAVNAAIQAWYGVVAQSEGLKSTIGKFHYAALTVKLETILMEAGIYPDPDGRLKKNKE
jgi:hypothetical protein